MNTETLKIARLFPAAIFVLFLAMSCIDENYEPNAGSDGKEKDITFSLTLPGHSTGGSTYALSGSDEEDVQSVEVLLFASGGNYLETRTVAAAAITGSGSTKTFTVKIPEGTYSSLVVLANSYEIVFGAGLSTSDTKATALGKLNMTSSAKWVTNNTSGSYKAIPMWGEVGSTTVSQSTSSTSQYLSLTRMLAKVSVSLATQAAMDNFKLETIRVYNYYNKGSAVPATANWNLGLGIASVPQGAAKPAVTTPYTTLTYSGSEITTADIASINEIYLFESDNNLQSDLLDHTCLVLGGTYTGDGKTYYYRVDFVDNTSDTDIYLNILRNRHYKFNVTKISGPGYKDPDEAFAARPFNIEATVIAWDDAEIKNVGTDGQYMLGVSQMEYNLAADRYTLADGNNKLTITTDYPGGWAISSIIDDATGIEAEWLRVDPEELSGGTGKKTISLLLDPNDNEGSRSAKVAVTAGTITIAVKVSQNDVPNLELNIKDSNGNEITELVFYSETDVKPVTQQFTVSWAPKGGICTITSTAVGAYPFDYGSGNTLGSGAFIQTSTDTGSETFTIEPSAFLTSASGFDPFITKISKVDFTINDGVRYLSKSLYLRHINCDLIPSGYKGLFPLDGEHSFTVKANATWTARIENNSNTDVTINMLTPNSNGNTSGEAFRFTLTYTGSAIATAGTFDVVFTNATGKFSERRCAIMWANGTVWAGSNIYWDNLKETLVFDDYNVTAHEKYQGVFFTWGSLWAISPSGNWSTSTPVYKFTPPHTYTKSTVAYWATIIPTCYELTDSNRNSKYLTEKVHTPANTAKGLGDICKHLTEQAGGRLYDKKWRMPTAHEFESLATESFNSGLFVSASNSNDYKWETTTWSTISTVNDDGTTPISNGIRKSLAIGTPFFPASNYRSFNSGAISDFTGQLGNYWSASGSNYYGSSYLMDFGSSEVNFLSSQNGNAGATPVRCVVDESKE